MHQRVCKYELPVVTGVNQIKVHRGAVILRVTEDFLYVGTVREGPFMWHVLERVNGP